MALVGVAFSLGFIVGPMIGALFAIFSNKSTGPWFVLPSLLAFGLALGDLFVLVFCLKETLPKVCRSWIFFKLNEYFLTSCVFQKLIFEKKIEDVTTKAF